MKNRHEELEPGLMKDEEVGQDAALVMVLLTSCDRDFKTDYDQNVIEKMTTVSQKIFGGRRPYWWKAGHVLMPMDDIKINPSRRADPVDPVDRGVANLKLV